MAESFYEADDIRDAAEDAVIAICQYFSYQGLVLPPKVFGPLREGIAAALLLVQVEGVEG